MSSTLQDPFALVGTTLDGRFAIDRVVARGGFGIVYQGRQLRLRKTIAFKVLFTPPNLDPDSQRVFLDGFAQEAQTIAQLEHPAIVRVYDFGVSTSSNGKEMPWMALEWIEGQSLADFLKARAGRPLSPAEALTMLRPVFQALEFAHAQRVAHRDIKPSNIMLAGSGGGSMAGTVRTRLLDFGIAKVMNPEEGTTSGDTHTHALFSAFSLPYASPEQKAAMRTGPWTDVHALGLILTEMLTGHAPYPGRDRLEVEMRIMSPVRPTPALFNVDVGPWEAAIARAVALRAPDRFQDAGAFLAALEASVPTARTIALNVPSTTEPVQIPAGALALPVAPARPLPISVVSPSTITDAPTVSAVSARSRASSKRRALAVAGGVGALFAVIAGTVVSQSASTTADTSHAAASTPAPTTGPRANPPPTPQSGPVVPPRPATVAHATTESQPRPAPGPAVLAPAPTVARPVAQGVTPADAGVRAETPRAAPIRRPRRGWTGM